jgi:tetratricopeptide (TPR) repeat protein
MKKSGIILLLFVAGILLSNQTATAKKVLVFDEQKGIIWVEEGKEGKKDKKGKKEEKKEAFDVPTIGKEEEVVVEKKTVRVRRHVKIKPASSQSYLKTGKKFYSSGDYKEAIRYFNKAWRKQRNPVYYFWIGACYRKIEKHFEMVSIFKEIVEKFPRSNVADDALFYLAVHAQKRYNYRLAISRYREVVELYPNGVSEMGGFAFREEAKKQLRAMKIDILSRLKLLNYTNNNPVALIKKFQEGIRLPITGKPDRKTMMMLVKASDRMEKGIRKKIKDSDTVYDVRLINFGFMAFLLLFNILWGFRNLNTLNSGHNRAKALFRTLE